ncbi:ArnT family glycosyltransferase [Roseisalinus antarcticus]|uniref:Undecaprenyl phosphate-alpha-4-amino-4-deoxy-L-arabinose arabinosyl transferase n=1 Tax=Roseisalinus antarcticus TaxID=254357 RepID=A0A1Y5RMM4_9RHOB|nr:hypothetical protein [Roseisalinus antarcticus]SLN18364.1 Undecaprenyl phosphate-alpha-4-amino-4-deoxy-L-arabinose arabinosyl transferase [Roseisalinus antarcticus]
MTARLWTLAVRFGPWLVAVLILAQVLPALDARDLWYSDEVRYAEAYSNLIGQGKWAVLELNGAVYPDKPPVYFLLLAAIHFLTGLEVTQTLFLGSAVSAILLAGAMARLGAVVGLTAEERLAGLLTWIGGLGVMLLLHYVRMDLLFVAFMLLGQAFLHDHVINRKPAGAALAGFACLGLAVLTKGPLGAAIPLVALVATALWAGEGRRLASGAMALGVLVMLAVLGLWVAAVIGVEGWAFFAEQIIGQQVVARAVDTFHHSEPVYYYIVVLPFLILPWTGFATALPLRQALSQRRRLADRRRARHPVDMLGLGALAGFVLLSSLDGKVGVYLLPVLCLLHMVLGAALMQSSLRSGRVASALLAALLAVALAVFGTPYAAEAGATWATILGTLLLLAMAATLVVPATPGPRVLALGGIGTLLGLVLATGLLPILSGYASPRPLAERLMAEAAQGAAPMTYRTYSGVFTYYAGRDLPEYADADSLLQAITAPGPAVIVTPRKHWEGLALDGFDVLEERGILGGRGDYLIVRERP